MEQGFAITIDVMSDKTFEEVEEAIGHAIQNSECCKGITLLSIYPPDDKSGPIPIDSEGNRV